MRIIILLLLTAIIVKGNNFIDETDKLITHLTYNLQIEKADSLISQKIAEFPDSPKYYLLKIGNELMRSVVLVEAAESNKKRAVKDSLNKVTLNIAQTAADKFEDIELTLENKFYMGGLYGYLGRFYGMEGSWMSSFSYGKKGKNLLEEVIEEDPQFYDAYLLLGMFNYYADRMGGVVGFIASVLGFSGDREQGIKFMEIAANKGTLAAPQAKLLLAELYCRLEDNDFKSAYWFEKFLEEYPQNYHAANWYLREALSVDLAYRVKTFIDNHADLIYDLNLGEYYFKIGEYEKAQNYLNQFLKEEHKYWRFYHRAGEVTLRLNNFMLNGKLEPQSEIKLGYIDVQVLKDIERFPEIYQQLFRFTALVNKVEDNSAIVKEINFHKQLKQKRIEAFYQFEFGKYYFFIGNYKTAAKFFVAAQKLNPQWLGYKSSKFLIECYLNYQADLKNVEALEDFIDELDSEKLSWSFMDLEVKYEL